MTATHTVQNVIDRAMQRNQLNDTTKIASDAELVGLISRKQQEKFLEVARINPDFFGEVTTITLSGSDADLSTISPLAAAINMVQVAAEAGSNYDVGDRIYVVATDEQDAELAPRMIFQRNKLTALGTDLNGVTQIKIYYSRLPATMNTATDPDSLNMDMPDEFIDTIVSEVALHLAIKDNRSAEEIAGLKVEVNEALANLSRAARAMTQTSTRFA